MARSSKSENIYSTTGLIPAAAAPIATPVKPASAIGVFRTLSPPNSS